MTPPAHRRAALPGADELFRVTGAAAAAVRLAEQASGPSPHEFAEQEAPSLHADANRPQVLLVTDAGSFSPGGHQPDRVSSADSRRPGRRSGAERGPSGRERHEEKITVYVSAAELVDLERARLTLRADHGLGIDRGRIVREALTVVLADLESKGEESILVRRLRGR